MPKISIIMPVYNKQNYIRRSLDSVLNQDFSDFELIAVDDGSTDDSLQILKEYQAEDQRIKIIHTDNHGVSHARNTGLDRAEGEYLTFVDADDELRQGYLKSLYGAIKQSGADMVIQGITKVFSNGHSQDVCADKYKGFCELADLLTDFASIQKDTGVFGFCAAKLFPAYLTEGIHFDETLGLAEDFDYYLNIYRKIKTVYLDDNSYYLYYQDLMGSSADVRDEDIDYSSQFKINLRYRELLNTKNCYAGENKKIVDQIISFNMFHMLFYSSTEDFPDYCREISKSNVDSVDLQSLNNYRKIVLKTALNGQYRLCRLLLSSYRAAHTIKRLIK